MNPTVGDSVNQSPQFALLFLSDPVSQPAKQTIKCPSCGRPFVVDRTSESMPFCSMRCKMADLNSWFDERIGLPHTASDEDDDEPESPPPIREIRFD